MKVILQRVKRASVRVDGEEIGRIDRGLLLLVGVGKNDDRTVVEYLAEKILNLRVFNDPEGKINLSVREVEGDILVVSQFTLYGDTRKGRRPSFTEAAPPREGERLYLDLVDCLKAGGLKVLTGVFGAMMEVDLVNDGPVTLILERENETD
jgi:D-tyrosyl-tRNA(Tyr) deacylase